MAVHMQRRPDGGLIDRSRPLSFSFNGQPCFGFAGDTLASALLANDVHLVGRSPLYGRPRALMGTGWTEQNGYVHLTEQNNTRCVLATKIELYEGLQASSILPWPPPKLMDRLRHADDGPTPAEDLTHNLARATYASQSAYDHCDILVVGCGPAGLASALVASKGGARVIALDEDRLIGGSMNGCDIAINGASPRRWVNETEAELKSFPDTHIYTNCTAMGLDESGRVIALSMLDDDKNAPGIASGSRFLVRKITARKIIVATGASERLLTFPDNDAPGIWLASAVLENAVRYGLMPKAQNVMVLTNNDDGYQLACALKDQGIEVQQVCDLRANINAEIVGALCDRGIDLNGGHIVCKANAEPELTSVQLRRLNGNEAAGKGISVPCDLLLVSGGWNPRLDFLQAAGGTLAYSDKYNCLVPKTYGDVAHLVGAATGDMSLTNAFTNAINAGKAALKSLGFKNLPEMAAPIASPSLTNLNAKHFWRVDGGGAGGRTRQFVDLRQDITADDAERARDPDSAAYLGTIEDLQMKTPRPSISLDRVMTQMDKDTEVPKRYLPTHQWHAANNAAFRLNNQWLRPALYVKEGAEHAESVREEMAAVRGAAGLYDLSSIGRLSVYGADAEAFLDYVSTSDVTRLEPLHSQYMQMLDDSGAIFDRGVLSKLGEHTYELTTSQGGAERVGTWLKTWLETDFAKKQIFISDLSYQDATLLLTGPRARQILLELDKDIDISIAAFPHMAVRQGHIMDQPTTLKRTSFTGEVSFEVSVAAGYAQSLWEHLVAAGARFGLQAIGEDALTRLAAEKGRVDMATILSQALSPADLNPASDYEPKPADFIGKRALTRPGSIGRERMQVVALKTDEPDTIAAPRSVIFQPSAGEHADELNQGRVITSFYSAALDKVITLALVIEGHARIGEIVHVNAGSRTAPMRISRLDLYDPNGRRCHG